MVKFKYQSSCNNILLSIITITYLLILVSSTSTSPREKINFDFSWRHKLNDNPNGALCPEATVGINYGTGGRKLEQVKTPTTCCSYCSNSPTCECWDWNNETQLCYLKNTDCSTKVVDEKRISGRYEKSNNIPSEAKMDYKDDSWQLVDTPHDMLITQPLNQSSSEKQAFLPRNSGWYRKHFYLPDDWLSTKSYIWWRCEGSFHETTIYLNGQRIGIHKQGYTSFSIRLDNLSNIKYGKDEANVLALFVDATTGTGWWYEGGGLMRHNYIIRTNQIHFVEDSAWVYSTIPQHNSNNNNTPFMLILGNNDNNNKTTSIHIKADIYKPSSEEIIIADAISNNNNNNLNLVVSANVLDHVDNVVGKGSFKLSSRTDTISIDIPMDKPIFWSVQDPYLYTIEMKLIMNDSTLLDSINITHGIRSVRFSSKTGLYINNENVKLRGFCDHSTFAAVGGAVADRINLYRVQTIRSVGGNSWRMAHNPPIPSRLDYMDALGMMAIDENRDYGGTKGQGGDTIETANDELKDMTDLIKRDRSHPSVIIWSFCNEVGCYNQSSARPWREISKLHDPTRAVTQNHHGSNISSFYLDVQGFSHRKTIDFEMFHKLYPDKPTMATECCSCMSQRGIDKDMCKDPQDGGCGGIPSPTGVFYNNNIGECTAQQVQISDHPEYIAGTFVWSGFDYLGEARGWPQNTKCRGTISDVAGFTKETAYWLRSWWLSNISTSDPGRPLLLHYEKTSRKNGIDNKMIYNNDDDDASWTLFIVDTWKAPLEKYKMFPRNITVYTNAPTVKMFLNDELVDTQSVPFFGLANFSIPYKDGTLTAVAFDSHGKEVKRFNRRTPGNKAVKLVLSIDVPSLSTGTGEKLVLDGEDVAMIRAEILDENGNVLNGANNNVTFEVKSGPGKIWGTHNGDPANVKPSDSTWTNAYQGLARAIIRTTMDSSTDKWHRQRMLEMIPRKESTVDILIGDNTNIDMNHHDITIRAFASGIMNDFTITIPTSTNLDDLPLQVAKRLGRRRGGK